MNNWVERFFSKVRFDKSGCWLWTAALTHNGYARFYSGQKTVRAHRFLLEKLIGTIPRPLEPDHLCRRRNCVAPHHLEVVTKKINIARRKKGYSRRRKTYCKRGHRLDKSAYWYRGNPTCRLCITIRQALYRARVKH